MCVRNCLLTLQAAAAGGASGRGAVSAESCVLPLQLLMNLRRSITTLDICGEWGGDREATLEMSLGNVYVQGRAPQKRLSALQVYFPSCSLQLDAAQARAVRLQRLYYLLAATRWVIFIGFAARPEVVLACAFSTALAALLKLSTVLASVCNCTVANVTVRTCRICGGEAAAVVAMPVAPLQRVPPSSCSSAFAAPVSVR